MIRIISGIFRGRKIYVTSGKNVKATSDQVREAIFNILSSYLKWEEIIVIDLYAGSGSLGFEALSRGAKKIIFVEIDNKKIETLSKNISLLNPEGRKVELIKSRALQWIKNFGETELECVIFIDPPFSSNEYNPILEKLSILSFVREGSFIVVQTCNRKNIIIPKNLAIIKKRRYGSVIVLLLQKY